MSNVIINICLHYVLDEWFDKVVKPRMERRCSMTRFADDFVMVFEDHNDAHWVKRVISKRFARYNLELHPDKTYAFEYLRC